MRERSRMRPRPLILLLLILATTQPAVAGPILDALFDELRAAGFREMGGLIFGVRPFAYSRRSAGVHAVAL